MRRHRSNACALALFTIMIACNIACGSLLEAASYLLYASIWILLTVTTVEGNGFGRLPTRDAFLQDLQHRSAHHFPPDQQDCSICYQPFATAARFDCGHIFCSECVGRLFPAGGMDYDYRCPYCRRALFCIQAPWDTIVVKLYVCTVVVGFIESCIVASYVAYHFSEMQLSWWDVLHVYVFLVGLYRDIKALRWIWGALDRNSLMDWEPFSSRWFWILAPFQVYGLLSGPWQIHRGLARLVSAEAGL